MVWRKRWSLLGSEWLFVNSENGKVVAKVWWGFGQWYGPYPDGFIDRKSAMANVERNYGEGFPGVKL